MIRWEDLGETPVPGGGALKLTRRGDEYVIRVDGNDLMSSRVTGSEKALADLACERLTSPQTARILIGGLGMGFTLEAALEGVGESAEVMVAELVPGVVEWNRGVLGPLAGNPLDDPRVVIHEGDVRQPIRKPGKGFDAILLDVDNGPDSLTRDSNAWLYTRSGLDAARAALTSAGVLAVWSAFDDPRFTSRLGEAGFEVEVIPVRTRGKKGARHTIWVATKPA